MSNNKPVRNLKEAFSYTTAVNGTTWDPTKDRTPFRVMSGLGYLDDVLKGIISHDEKAAKAPKILPFPLDRIIDQLANCYEELMKARMTLQTSVRSALLSKEGRKKLRKDVDYINKCLSIIKLISKDVEQTHL